MRRTINVTVTALSFLAGSAAFAQTPLSSAIFPPDSARSRKVGPTSTQRSLVDTVTTNLSKLEMHETTVPPGQAAHAAHKHAHEELILVRRGTIEASFGNETRKGGPGSVLFMASNEMHGLRNGGTDSLTYLIIRMDPHDLAQRAGAANTLNTGRATPQ